MKNAKAHRVFPIKKQTAFFILQTTGIIVACLYNMKNIFILLILLISIAAFAIPQKKKTKKAKQKETITKVEYQTFTRRGRTEVTITKDSAITIGSTERKFILMTPGKWNEITGTLKSTKLSSIPTWESPTKKREVDGASHCKMMVSTKANTYESQYFDGGKPMKGLKALYDAIGGIRNDIDSIGKPYGE